VTRRDKLAYAAGSITVTWVVASMLVAAGPASWTMAKIYPAFKPFLELADLEHEWGFFAPDPGTGHVVRYDVRDADGNKHAFRLTEELRRWDPAYFRLTTLYTKFSYKESDYAEIAIGSLCRRHAALRPREARFVVAHQVEVSPEEFREGKGTMDELQIVRRPWIDCPEAG
jgi:Fe-S-cluster formation regulator IscX/YfhJ